jgi:hypothetical protein
MRLAIALALLAAGSASAQYREQQRPVLEPPAAAQAPDRSKEILEAFQSAYRAAGAPRIALFWNVVLTDQVAEGMTSSSRVRGENNRTVNRLEQQTSGEAGSSRLVDGDDRRTSDVTVNRTSRQTDSSKRGMPFAERDAWLLEGAFTKALLEGGADLIDRNLMMRITAASVEREGRDQRTVESNALVGKADVLLEVLLTQDVDSPLGWGFRVTLRDISTGRLKGSFYAKAIPEIAKLPAQFQATSKGFERVEVRPVVTVDHVGRKLALDAMEQLKDMVGGETKRR